MGSRGSTVEDRRGHGPRGGGLLGGVRTLLATGIAAGVLMSVGVSPATGAAPVVTEFSAGITGTPHAITAAPDGNLWFTEAGIGRITPSGVVTEFSAGITFTPKDIAAGPDGNLWFTEPGPGFPSKIGRITTSGDVTEFATGTSGLASTITAGPDGNLWFVESTAGPPAGARIGRITPSGSVQQFSAGITCPYLEGIASGPDGNVWFTEPACNRVGRITPAGGVTEFVVGSTPYITPSSIVTGPDGNLWFTEGGLTGGGYGPKIGRITPSGVVTHFSFAGGAWGITAGPDGNLWFTDTLGDSIGRFTLTGAVGYVTAGITPGSWPSDITVGPDGNLWFTETSGRRIGRMTPGEPPPPLPLGPPPSSGPLYGTPLPSTTRPRSLTTPLTVKAVGARTFRRGTRAGLVFRITNTTGRSIRAVVLVCTLPAGLGVDAISQRDNRRVRNRALRFTATGRTITFRPGTIAAGKAVVVRVNAKVAARATRGQKAITLRVRGTGVPSIRIKPLVTVR